MYELKGKAVHYIIAVIIWYSIVVLLCAIGNEELAILGVVLGVLPYIIIGCILLLCLVDRLIQVVRNGL